MCTQRTARLFGSDGTGKCIGASERVPARANNHNRKLSGYTQRLISFCITSAAPNSDLFSSAKCEKCGLVAKDPAYGSQELQVAPAAAVAPVAPLDFSSNSVSTATNNVAVLAMVNPMPGETIASSVAPVAAIVL